MNEISKTRQPIEVPIRLLEVKPIFVTPPTHTAKPGDTRTFTITLETKVPEASGDYYDIAVPMNSHLLASCPTSIHVNQGESSFDLTVKAAIGVGTGKVNIEMRERKDGGVITATLVVEA